MSSYTRNRGTHSGRYFTLDRYSDSSWNQREKNSSSRRHSRSTGPAPIRAPSSNTARNTAKLSEIRSTPSFGAPSTSPATMNSISPLSDLRSRRIRSRDRPLVPHGANERTAASRPCPSSASTSTHCPSAGSPRRPSAIEKPRSVSVSRHFAASSMMCAISAGEISACRRIRTV